MKIVLGKYSYNVLTIYAELVISNKKYFIWKLILMNKIWNSFKKFLKFVFKSKYYFLYTLYSFLSELSTKLVPVALIDIIVRLYQANKQMSVIVIYSLLFVLINLINNFIRFLFNKYDDKIERNIKEYVDREIINKYISLNVNLISTQEIQNDYVKNLQNGSNYIIRNYKNINQILSTIFVYFILLVYLGKYDIFACFISVIILIIYTILSNYTIRYDSDTTEKIKYNNRFKDYIKRVFTLKAYAQDLKTSNISNFLIERNKQLINNSQIITKKNIIKKNKIKILGNIFLKMYFPIAILLIILKYSEDLKLISPTIIIVILNLTNIMNSLSTSISYYFSNLANLSQLVDFYNLDNENTKMEDREFNTLEFENVNFKYDNYKEFELKKISFTITKGEKIILIGKNGSGKSTLVKLCLGLLQPNSGHVLYNNYDINKVNIKNNVAVLFQDFQLYATTIAENILLKKIETQEEERLVEQALIYVGLYDKIKQLKNGINTIVSKEFDDEGIEFSRGEKQKIALARIYSSKSNLIILDEPTSSLDVISEKSLFENIFTIFKDRTIIVVTHKFHEIFKSNRTLFIENGVLNDFENYNDYIMKMKIS